MLYFSLSLFANLLTPNSVDDCWHLGFCSPLAPRCKQNPSTFHNTSVQCHL